MAKLTSVQKAQIKRHKIPLSKIFDASGLTQQQAIKAMSENKEIVMVNGLLCKNDNNHVLRARYGHCVECNPSAITFQSRKRAEGEIYLAGSQSTGLLKIGMAQDTLRRKSQLRKLKYGGASDWDILASAKAFKAGLVEYTAQQELSKFQVHATYSKDGRDQACFELFEASHKVALDAFIKAVLNNNGELIEQLPITGKYGTELKSSKNQKNIKDIKEIAGIDNYSSSKIVESNQKQTEIRIGETISEDEASDIKSLLLKQVYFFIIFILIAGFLRFLFKY